MIRTVMHEMSAESFARQCCGGRCPICGLPARNIGDAKDDSQNVACRRCGGFTLLSSGAIDNCCEKHDVSVEYGRALISYYIHKEWLELDARFDDYGTGKIHYATLNYTILNSFLERGSPSASEQVAECMELIGSEIGRNGRYAPFSFAERYGINMSWAFAFFPRGLQHSTELNDKELIGSIPQFYLEVVRTLCVFNIDAVEYFFSKVLCQDEGFLDKVEPKRELSGGHSLDRSAFVVTPKGWKFLEGDNLTPLVSKSVFVAMWFAAFTKPLREVIRKVLRDKNYNPVFVDELPTRSNLTLEQRKDLVENSTIDDMIIANIRRAKFVIADLSCFPGEKLTSARYKDLDGNPLQRDVVCAGAYFEAGYAMALGKPILYLINKGQKPHFDVNHVPYITWDEDALEDLEIQLKSGIEARGL